MKPQRTNIAIVGAGAAGIATYIASVQRLRDSGQSDCRLVLFSRTADLGAGMAYRQHEEAFTLNMTIAEQSIDGSCPMDYGAWRSEVEPWIRTQTDGRILANTEHAPRFFSHYYHRQRASLYKHLADEAGIETIIVQSTVVDMQQQADGRWSLLTEDHAIYQAHYVVLALGNFVRKPPEPYEGHSEVTRSPYRDLSVFDAIPGDETVAVIGTSLSGIDQIQALRRRNHNGRMLMLSRSGALPHCRPIPKSTAIVQGVEFGIDATHPHHEFIRGQAKRLLRAPRPLELDDIFNIAREVVSENRSYEIERTLMSLDQQSPGKHLASAIELATSGPSLHFFALRTVSDLLPAIYAKMTPESQLKWCSTCLPFFRLFAFPMPVVRAKELLESVDSEQLSVGQGRGVERRADGKLVVRYATRVASGAVIEREEVVSAIIPAIGQEVRLDKIGSRLITKLVSAGLLSAHPRGGIRIDHGDLSVLDERGQSISNLFALGSLTFGTFCLVSAVSRNVCQAEKIARAIAWDIEGYRGAVAM